MIERPTALPAICDTTWASLVSTRIWLPSMSRGGLTSSGMSRSFVRFCRVEDGYARPTLRRSARSSAAPRECVIRSRERGRKRCLCLSAHSRISRGHHVGPRQRPGVRSPSACGQAKTCRSAPNSRCGRVGHWQSGHPNPPRRTPDLLEMGEPEPTFRRTLRTADPGWAAAPRSVKDSHRALRLAATSTASAIPAG
jgi:hypothetical protein